MTFPLFDKTEKGREEIATRKHHLAPRLRTLLLLIDGKHATEELLAQVAGLGLGAESVSELLDKGFIRILSAPAASPVPTPAPAAPVPQEAPPLDAATRFEAIYHFYTETIKGTLGLRGYALQLKVERAGSIEDFRALRLPYMEAVLKAKGREVAKGIKMRLDEVLYAGETIPPLNLPDL